MEILKSCSWAAQIRVSVLNLSSTFLANSMFRWCQTRSSFSCLRNWPCNFFSLHYFTSSSTASFLNFSGFTAASTSTTPDAFTISSHCPPLLFLTYYSTLFSLLWIYLSQTYETPSTYFSWHIKHFNITLKIWSTPFESFCPIPSTPLLSTLKVGGVGVSAFWVWLGGSGVGAYSRLDAY